MKTIAVVLCWNSKSYISSCLKSLLAVPRLQVVVVDNASTDRSVAYLRKKFPKLKILANPANLGYAGGNNAGLRYALNQAADFVWVINPDITVSPDCLKYLLQAARNYPQAGIFGPKIYFSPGFEFHQNTYSKKDRGRVIWSAGGCIDWANLYGTNRGVDQIDVGQFDWDSPCDYISGACLLIRLDVLRQVGLFDDKYFLYYEENDLCQRAKKAGWGLQYVAKAVAWHANAQATGAGSSLVDYYITRNRLLFGLKWAPLRTKIALIAESLRLLFFGRPYQRRGVADFYTRHLGLGSYA